MTVIPLRPRGRSPVHGAEPYDGHRAGEARGPALGISIPLRGSFPSPSGRKGTMTGSVRLESADSTGDHLWVQGVFTGELVDADGSHIGTTSRRKVVPARVARDVYGAPTVVGPFQVDLLGLTVSVQAFVADADTS